MMEFAMEHPGYAFLIVLVVIGGIASVVDSFRPRNAHDVEIEKARAEADKEFFRR